ncbi:MAG: AAA family ATPase [Candidatus Levybacteria bacterium]|nr:AAA family ATPase [Candidatus Levybacteria bacterium]
MDQNPNLESQIQKLEEKAKSSQLPQYLFEKIEGMITLLRASLKSGSGTFINFESVSNYINWVISLPFHKETKDALDLNLARQILDKNHFGLDSVKNRILEYLASIILSLSQNPSGVLHAPILCLIGLVGTGKTTLAYSIAEALGRKFERIPFGGMGDARALRGQSRAMADAEPGAVIKKIIHAQSKNSVILLDELDRVTEAARADIMGVLVELLDPEQNRAFTDHYVDYPFDLSRILFVSTANNTTNISTAVLDRLEIVQMPSYTDEEKIAIAKNYLFPKIRKQTGLSENQLLVDESVWPSVIRPLGFDSGIRSLERTIDSICRKTARFIVEGKVPHGSSVHVTLDNVKQFLTA